ncbi:D-alanyl-D-alanine carboxypeptidase (penicillin-binding protein 5/6) [Steroidobacter denitrificans]|uniref:serine-type D-Ala-D-Ala carboxypeptidase n=1 Tax=Steroidobacter denitrificans TaxID=465721 RepID=A0A127F8H0_STEDE|nr:D-alanyl-D-alanine carboxypeptidase (penicillin-binding protein 5/6) [Steroidobacter denitrificans]
MSGGLGGTSSAVKPPPIPAAPQINARGYILMDFVSGQVLAATNENERLEPASLTKLMSAYAVFHALKDGRIKLDDPVRISTYARAQEGSRMFVEAGSLVSVEDLIQGMIVQSGNDATVALAEHVAGSDPVFVDLMNQYARQLGMTSTHFQNSPGMPSPEHYTTSRDIGLLAAALIRDYPEYYHWYSQRAFTWNRISQPNRNGLLERDPSVDGLKTGHTESAGYCLVTSAKRDTMRLVSVVMGAPSMRAREDASAALLNYGFGFYQTRRLYAANAPVISLRTWKGRVNEAVLGVQRDVYATFGRGQEHLLKVFVDVREPLIAPLEHGAAVGQLRVMLGDQQLGAYALHPTADVPQAGLFGRLIDGMKLWMH